MGEICRDSTTSAGPRLLKIGHSRHRHDAGRSLVVFAILVLLFQGSGAFATTPVTRGEFLEKAYRALMGVTIIEDRKAVLSFLEPYPDGMHHLEWPMARGAALRSLVAMLGSVTPTAEPLPASFADIPPASPYYPLLQILGGAFGAGGPDERFQPEALLTQSDLANVLKRMSTRPPPALGTAAPVFDQTGALFPAVATSADVLAKTSHLARIQPLVPSDQLAPHTDFDLEAVAEGITDMDQTLSSLEVTVFDLAGREETLEPAVEAELVSFFSEVQAAFEGMTDKLRAAKTQLDSALLVDPSSIRRCQDLRRRLIANMQRIALLRDQIRDRLDQRAPGTNAQSSEAP